MAKINPIDIYEIPDMNGLMRDGNGNLYYNQKHWNTNSSSGNRTLIDGIATIKLHGLDKDYYIAKVEFLNKQHHWDFYGDASGIKGNPWRVNSAGVLKIPNTESAMTELYDLIIERTQTPSTINTQRSFNKFLGSLGF